MIELVETNDAYIDGNKNEWSKASYSKENAEMFSKYLVEYGCYNCKNCEWCMNCRYCENCITCIGCTSCKECCSCVACIECTECEECLGLTNKEFLTKEKAEEEMQ